MDKLIEKIKSNGKTVYLLNDDEINEVANITKEVACGFYEWINEYVHTEDVSIGWK